MDKITSALCPHEVGTSPQLPILCVILEVAVLGKTLAGIVGIEKVLPRLHVLDAHLTKKHIQVMPRHVQFLADLCHGETRNAVEHMVRIIGPRLELGNLLIPTLECGLHDLERSCHDDFIAFILTGYHVSSLLTDARENFGSDPMLESSCTFELGGEDEGVKTAFVYIKHHLISACGRGVPF